MEIMIKPIVTEKATATSEKLNRYTFRVSPDANKEQIKKLIQNMYGVKLYRSTRPTMTAKESSATQRQACNAARQQRSRKLMSR